MKDKPVPSPVVRRLSLYLRELEYLCCGGVLRVSSRQLADSLSLTAAQVRKDLACFGQFGRPGVGYTIVPLMEELRRILGTDKMRQVVLVGVGGLGGALLRHKGFRRRGFEIVAAVDVAPARIGRRIGGVLVEHVGELPRIVRGGGVKLAIVTVPASSAQAAAEALSSAGIAGILNFSPANLSPLDGVAVEPVDIAARLEQLCFRVSAGGQTSRGQKGIRPGGGENR